MSFGAFESNFFGLIKIFVTKKQFLQRRVKILKNYHLLDIGNICLWLLLSPFLLLTQCLSATNFIFFREAILITVTTSFCETMCLGVVT